MVAKYTTYLAYSGLFLSICLQANIAKKLPDEISFCIADIKYTGTSLKILEFGEGSRSKFSGHDNLYGVGTIWKLFWDHLKEFSIPVWCVRLPDDSKRRDVMAPDYFFEHLGGHTAGGITDLKLILLDELKNTEEQQAYEAAVMVRQGRPIKTIAKFKEIFPQVRFIGEVSNPHVTNKYKTNALFDTPELISYRPACKVCSKLYTPILAQEIINTLNCSIYVIKPVNAYRGRGVILVERQELDNALNLILNRSESLKDSPLGEAYSYWAEDKNNMFIVEGYEPSKIITVNDKQYDATMRLVFALERSNNEIIVEIFGGYWKLPAKSLDEEGTLTEKHKSDMKADGITSAPIDPEDMEHASEILKSILPKIYERMLASNS